MTVELVARGESDVLVVEDVADTMAFVLRVLRRTGCNLVVANDLDEARRYVRDRVFDFLLVDVRIPFGSLESYPVPNEWDEVDAGLIFIHELKAGSLGMENRDTRFAMITSFKEDVDESALEQFQGYTKVVSKTAADMDDLIEVMGLESSGAPHGAFLARDLMRCDEQPDRRGYLYFEAPGWPIDERIPIRLDALPDDIQQEIAWGDFPVYIWSTLNIDAARASDTSPHNFELSGVSDEALTAFYTDAKSEDEIS